MRYQLVEKRWLVVREGEHNPRILGNPDAVYNLVKGFVADDEREHFYLIFLDAQNHYKGHHEVSVGTLSASLVHPREVFKPAILASAASIILVHNHPSGDPTPSTEDTRLTQQLVACSKLLDIRIHDHLILGNGSGKWVSFATRGQL